MIETHKSATSFVTISVFIFSTYCQPSVLNGDAICLDLMLVVESSKTS